MAPGLKAPRRPKPAARPNPIKAIQDQAWQQQRRASQSPAPSMSPAPQSRPQQPGGRKSQCPNKNCPNPNIVDGTCRTCGRVADDSNIVAEIQFGETAGGAAVVQGSYVGPDGGVRLSGGQGGRRIAGTNTSSEAREKALREARSLIQGFANSLNLPERTVNGASQLFKLASSRNFTQGRSSVYVAAMCLYAACRKETSCKIMLMDLADLVQHDVFHLGRMYKAFISDIGAGGNYNPIFVEDLIYRFAARLEFGDKTNKVASTAVRLVQRMDRDWMVLGRRPSGICGACLIMAARMNNFRRTVREVVFIAKVTMHTLQQRLNEFAEVPSAKLTVDDFLMRDFLYEQMDPPAYYKKTAEYQAKLKERRKKRKRDEGDDEEEERRVDADGFAIPAVPNRTDSASTQSQEPSDIEEGLSEVNSHLDDLARQFGSQGADPSSSEAAGSPAPAASGNGSQPGRPKKQPQGSSVRKLPKVEKPAYVTEEWDEDEELLEMEITENMMNPSTTEGAMRLANAAELAALKFFADPEKQSHLDKPEVEEDEFADDPEVMYCLLGKEEVELKTRLWVNQNKDWMRKQQEKEFKARLAATNPPKPGRGNRAKKPRIGEGQTSPADSATDATLEMIDRRQFSKRIDYDAVRSMLSTGGPGSAGGSLATSRQTSRAGSVAVGGAEEEEEDEEEEEEEEDETRLEDDAEEEDEQPSDDE
ncbi:hypothetical protein PspLS_04229 [Pyricularia sp. CBS 133598]|nr:hypothetical protein PspLS_04229 [Pyricularia sp. CBS 133598]